jgi:hypothetical protein
LLRGISFRDSSIQLRREHRKLRGWNSGGVIEVKTTFSKPFSMKMID